uniref:RRM domain-containing protein n=1 Tax=Oryza glaberrima TaxID=4538 RepID=I1R7G9_ORYGL
WCVLETQSAKSSLFFRFNPPWGRRIRRRRSGRSPPRPIWCGFRRRNRVLTFLCPFFFFFFFVARGGFQEKRGAASHGDYDEQDRRVKGAEVFVGGLPRSVTERALREVFSPCGEIVDLRIMKDQNGISKGYGFVRFAERECAYIAKRQINGFEARISNFLFDLQGKRLAVDLSLDQDTLFFGNLCKVLFDQH